MPLRLYTLLALMLASAGAAHGQACSAADSTAMADAERMVGFILQHPHGIYGADPFSGGGVNDALRAQSDAVLTYIECNLTLSLPEPGTPRFIRAVGKNVALAAVGTLVGGERAQAVVVRVSDPILDVIAPASKAFETYFGTPAWNATTSAPEVEAAKRVYVDVYRAFSAVAGLLSTAWVDREYAIEWARGVLETEGVVRPISFGAERIIWRDQHPGDIDQRE